MYISEFSDLDQNFWEKLKADITTPIRTGIQTGIQTAQQQARERLQTETSRFIEQQGQKLWERIFGKQPSVVPTSVPEVQPVSVQTKPFTILGLQPLHFGLLVVGVLLLYIILKKRK